MFRLIASIASGFVLAGLLAPAAPAQTSPLRARAEVHEMQQVEDAWDAAVDKRDQYGLENVLSPLLVDIAATGDVTSRNQDVAKLFVKDSLPASLKQTVLDVRSLGDSVRIVNGTYVMHWLAAAGAPAGTPAAIDEKGIFTQVFQQVNGRWSCINSQRTVVADVRPEAKSRSASSRAASRPRSNAAEPFHIPLLYPGAQPTQSSQPDAVPPPAPK